MAKNNKPGTKLGRDLYCRYMLDTTQRTRTLGIFSKHIRPLVEADTFNGQAFQAAIEYCRKKEIPDDLLRYLLRAMLGHAVAVEKGAEVISTMTQALQYLRTPKKLIENANRTGQDFRTAHANCECAGALAASHFFAEVFGIELDLAPVEEEPAE